MTASPPVHLRFRVVAQQAIGRPDWQHELARRLGVSPRSVRRWAAGRWPVPSDIWTRLETLNAAPQQPRRGAP